FHMEGGSWTNDISWVRGYDNVLGPMEKASSQFFEKVLKPKKVSPSDPRFRNALFHLMCSQTSCYRYWGQGLWTDYGREICRRASSIAETDF
ncbi:MAG TPA: glycosyl hydrolase family 57, partial [Candidatus Competibacter sp.]|nr:glycosyl hydrolase family 57 [Candidatus Competibacter sp.]